MKARKLKDMECWNGFVDYRGGSWWASSVQLHNWVKVRRCRSWMQAVRVSLGITQKKMAKNLEISQSYLCKMEIGTVKTPEYVNAMVADMHARAMKKVPA